MRAHGLIATRAGGIGLLLLAAACRPSTDAPAAASSPAAAMPAATASAAAAMPIDPEPPIPASTPAAGPEGWVGRWNGPEGTSLVLAPRQGGGFVITITTLDGPSRYEGDAAGPGIVFERDGETQTLRAGNGKLTGMKWLADKSDCLVIKVGEGYCRD